MPLVTQKDIENRDLSNAILVFDHIPKCGGVTFDVLMTGLLPEEAIQNYNLLQDYTAPVRDSTRFIAGHLTWGVHHAITKKDVFYFTFIRDPLRIALSFYHYLHNTRALDLCCEEYLTQQYPHNFLVRHLGAGSLAKATQMLCANYACFGIVEQYTKSLQLLFGILKNGFLPPEKLQCIPLKKANVSRQQPKPLPQEIIDYFHTQNAADYALYAHALKLFNNQHPADEIPFREQEEIAYTDVSNAAIDLSKQHNYAKVIEISQAASDSEIQRKEFEISIDAALKIGDLRLAREIAQRSERVFPFHCFDRYLQVYEQSRDYQACLDYVRKFKIFFLDSGFSNLECTAAFLHNKVLLRQKFYEVLLENSQSAYAAFETFTHGLQYDTLSRPDYAELVGILTQLECAGLIDALYERLRCLNPGPGLQELLTPIALFYYNHKQAQKASAALQILRAHDPLKFSTLQALLVLRQDGSEEAVPALEQLKNLLPDQNLGNRIVKQLFTHRYQQGEIALHSLSAQGYHSPYSDSLLAHTVRAQYPFVEFNSITFAPPVLVIASGPKVIFDLLQETLFSNPYVFDVLGSQALESHFKNLSTAREVFQFPGNAFHFKRDYDQLASKLPANGYGSCLFFMSQFALQDYWEIIALAETVTQQSLYFYVYDQIFSDVFRYGLFEYSSKDG